GMVVFLVALVAALVTLKAGMVAAFLLASAVAGAAQGTALAGAVRAMLGGARAEDRAGILAAVYLTSYSGSAIPGLITAQLSRSMTLFDIAIGYVALTAVAAAATVAGSRALQPERRR